MRNEIFFKMKNFDCYLFDLDGTLIDTSSLIYNCFCESLKPIAKKWNVPIEKSTIAAHIGRPLKDQMQKFFAHHNIIDDDIDYEKLCRNHMNFQKTIWKDYVKVFDEAKEVLLNLVERKKKLAIVTSRGRETTDLYLKHFKLYDFFDCIVTADDTLAHKPDAAPALKALSFFDASLPKEKVLFVGDSVHDQFCAKNAGLPFFLVVRKNTMMIFPDDNLKKDCDYCESDLKPLLQ